MVSPDPLLALGLLPSTSLLQTLQLIAEVIPSALEVEEVHGVGSLALLNPGHLLSETHSPVVPFPCSI